MERKHFLQSMEREIDFPKEYRKLEGLCNVHRTMSGAVYLTLNDFIRRYFWEWADRDNFITFDELREHMGFPIEEKSGGKVNLLASDIDMNKYFLFCEMIMTLLTSLGVYLDEAFYAVKNVLFQTIESTIEKVGFECKQKGSEIQIVQKNAVALEVVELVPELADVIVEYNHYILRGNIEKKRMLLKQIADALEPQRGVLRQVQKRNTADFFELINTMNIRHNNLDSSDKNNYNAKFDAMSLSEKEAWYDLIYGQALGLFVTLEQQERNKQIDIYKQS